MIKCNSSILFLFRTLPIVFLNSVRDALFDFDRSPLPIIVEKYLMVLRWNEGLFETLGLFPSYEARGTS